MERHKVLNEIDETLDQLIKNATALHEVSDDPFYQIEVEALKKTQESLLAHLIHLDRFLKDESKDKTRQSIYDKLTIFSELSSSLAKQMRTYYSPTNKKRKESKMPT